MRDLKSSEEYLIIGGLSASTDDFNLFVAAIIALALSMALWVYLVWIGTDPGAVRSRNEDFDMVSRESTMISLRTELNRMEQSGRPTLRLTPLSFLHFLLDHGAVAAQRRTPFRSCILCDIICKKADTE